MAALAVLALAVTVILAQRALAEASDVVVRGEGDLLAQAVMTELASAGAPPTETSLGRVLAAHEADGLRYVGLLTRDGRPVLEAGKAEITEAELRPGHSTRSGKRVRLTGPLLPRRPPHSPSAMPPLPPFPPFPSAPGEHERPERRGPGGMPILVLELEPPVIETLRRDLTRIGVVGGLAGVVLLAFAVAWSRSAARLATVEAKAAREQRLVALGSMSSVMAHELRNPLASLKGHAQLLLEDLEEAGDAKKTTKAARVVAEAERIEALTTSLLDFVRDGPIERTTVAPRELVEMALADLDRKRVVVHSGAAPDRLDADTSRLARAAHNLIENALQAAETGEVEVEVAARGADVIVEVRDRGPGIPAGSETSIFEPFVTTRTKGTGLGLAVARRIAEQHEGTLTAANREGGGAVFTLRLPRSAGR